MKQNPTDPKSIGRRGFFGALAGASFGAVAAGTARPVIAEEVGNERTKQRYQETEHVLTFYRTNRYYEGG